MGFPQDVRFGSNALASAHLQSVGDFLDRYRRLLPQARSQRLLARIVVFGFLRVSSRRNGWNVASWVRKIKVCLPPLKSQCRMNW